MSDAITESRLLIGGLLIAFLGLVACVVGLRRARASGPDRQLPPGGAQARLGRLQQACAGPGRRRVRRPRPGVQHDGRAARDPHRGGRAQAAGARGVDPPDRGGVRDRSRPAGPRGPGGADRDRGVRRGGGPDAPGGSARAGGGPDRRRPGPAEGARGRRAAGLHPERADRARAGRPRGRARARDADRGPLRRGGRGRDDRGDVDRAPRQRLQHRAVRPARLPDDADRRLARERRPPPARSAAGDHRRAHRPLERAPLPRAARPGDRARTALQQPHRPGHGRHRQLQAGERHVRASRRATSC